MTKNLLITGGAGFIGSNFVHHWHRNYKAKSVVLDALACVGNRLSQVSTDEV